MNDVTIIALLKDVLYALNQIPNKGYTDQLGLKSNTYKLASRLDSTIKEIELNANTTKLSNWSFAAAVKNLKSVLYSYSLYQRMGVYQLTLTSSSLAELDGEDEGTLGVFVYKTQDLALEDIKLATKLYNIDFEEV